MSEGKFVLKRRTRLEDLESSNVTEIVESDLTIQTSETLMQFTYVDEEKNDDKFVIKPGCFIIEETSLGVALKPFELRQYELLESIDNTSMIFREANKFFNKLDVYKKLGKDPKRALLLASIPGVGKTSAINRVCASFLKEPGTVVAVWDTSDVRSSSVNKFFLNRSIFNKEVKKMIFIIEDIGGGTVEDYSGSRGADSSLLNLLDGIGSPFKDVPTFIIATTNNPEQSVGALIDRPGRFDKVEIMKTPNKKECEALLSFIAKRELTNEDKEAAAIAAKEGFSIAHIQEIVVRSLIDDISTEEAAHQLREHKKKFKKAFQETSSVGFGL